ncbi:hypothetical protein C7974DRAFT_310699, partial [Boeremia exigua]|uniref:uncharacterized protein n=1 Tax=Boeremia exigua TaxID=749465 RepID=UPI001E8D0FDD
KSAILEHGCNAVFHAAGAALMLGRSKTGEYNKLFVTVVAAIVEAREERKGPAIRAYLGSSAIPGRMIGDYMPMFPEHQDNLFLIQKQDEGNIPWLLFRANQMSAKYREVQSLP